MPQHQVATREEWLAARIELLEAEKELTRRSDALARRREQLPWVRVGDPYRFESTAGVRTLAELFDGRSQLLVYHLMYGPDWDAACPGCTFYADHIDGSIEHLAHHDVTFVCASGAPVEKIEAYRERFGWRFPWYSASHDYLLDFSLFTEQSRRTGNGFNFGTPRRADINILDGEQMGLNAFAIEDGEVFHTYATFDRGTDALNPTWQLLDRAPRGRFRTAGESDADVGWPRRRDEYPSASG
jgi:predicted dithiol-disulfide oxidoreductase (DUF899 family)